MLPSSEHLFLPVENSPNTSWLEDLFLNPEEHYLTQSPSTLFRLHSIILFSPFPRFPHVFMLLSYCTVCFLVSCFTSFFQQGDRQSHIQTHQTWLQIKSGCCQKNQMHPSKDKDLLLLRISKRNLGQASTPSAESLHKRICQRMHGTQSLLLKSTSFLETPAHFALSSGEIWTTLTPLKTLTSPTKMFYFSNSAEPLLHGWPVWSTGEPCFNQSLQVGRSGVASWAINRLQRVFWGLWLDSSWVQISICGISGAEGTYIVTVLRYIAKLHSGKHMTIFLHLPRLIMFYV